MLLEIKSLFKKIVGFKQDVFGTILFDVCLLFLGLTFLTLPLFTTRSGFTKITNILSILTCVSIIFYLIFTLYPQLYTAILGFTDLKGAGNTTWHFLPVTEMFSNSNDKGASGLLTSKSIFLIFGKFLSTALDV